MIEDNLEDFLNNTSVTVNQDFHYYNNTTYVIDDSEYVTNNEFQNTTNIDGGEINNQNYDQSTTYYNASSIGGNGSYGGIIYTIDFEFSLDFLWGNLPIMPGNRSNSYTTDWYYYDYQTNQYRTDEFTFDCEIYYLVGSANQSNQETYWNNSNYYDDAWSDNGYNNTLRDLFHNVAWNETLRFTCDDDFFGNDENQDWYYATIYSFSIPEGFAIKCLTDGYPSVYRYQNTAPEYYNYTDRSYPQMYVDGVEWHCQYPIAFGGESEMVVTFRASNLYEEYNYRLLFEYELIQVVPHDDADLES
jgi:hypothetical protein